MKKFLTFFEIILCVVALLALLGSFILPRLFEMGLERNEQIAQANLKQIIAPALENFATDNNGTYPTTEAFLVRSNPAYMNRYYNSKVIQGYVYKLDLSNLGYKIEARPWRCGIKGSGRKTYTITTGIVFNETDCNEQGVKK